MSHEIMGNRLLGDRVTVMEDIILQLEIFESLPSGTGTATKPTDSTIILDQYEGGADCLILKIDGTSGKPTGEVARTGAGTPITSTFNTSGAWALSGTPSAYPVALVYTIQIKSKNRANVSNAVLVNEKEVDAVESLATNSGLSLTNRVLAMGTPTAITGITTDAVTTNTHSHSISGFEPTLTKGNLTEATSSVLTIGNGTNSVIGSGTTIQVTQATDSNSGYITAAKHKKFNNNIDLTKSCSGFDNPNDVIVTYDSTARTVTLTGTFQGYWKGEAITSLTTGWVSDPHDISPTAPLYLYYNGSAFVWSVNIWTFDVLQIAYINYNAAGTFLFGIRETHGFMDWTVHKELHSTIGCYKSAGGTFSSWVASSTTAVNRRPDISSTTLQDEDLATVNPQLTSKTYTQYYLSSTLTSNYVTSANDIIPLSTANPYYNSFSTPNWGQTLMPSNSIATVWVYSIPASAGTTSQEKRYIFIQPQWITQAQSGSAGNLATARANELLRQPSEVNLGDLATYSSEIVCIARITIQYTSANWTIEAITYLSGSRYSQTQQSAGNFLNVVTTDGSLTGSGTTGDPLAVDTTLAITGLNLSGLTASELISTDGTKNLQSLAVATYPSLTELSYVKGVTSGIQAQINGLGSPTTTAVPFTTQTSVTVTHNKGFYPIVQVIDGGGAVLIPLTITHASTNAFTVTFDVSTSGNILYK
jgi:hypothetical protein